MTLSQLPLISIAGRTLAEPIRARLIEVVVDDHLVLPDSFTLRFSFDDELWDRLGAAMSAEVVIKAGKLGETPSDALITAEITGIEAVYEEGVRYLVVRGYDKSHRLHAGRRTRSFKNVTDSDIARKVASEAGIPVGTIEPTTLVHDHVSQINMTDWEFLRDRAAEVGFSVAVREGKFTFTSSEGEAGGGAGGGMLGLVVNPFGGGGPLRIDHELMAFRPRVTGSQQVGKVAVRGWDIGRREGIERTVTAETAGVQLNERDWSAADIAGKFGNPTYVVCDRPIRTVAEADKVAESAAEEVASSFAEADGTAIGDPRLVTGTIVEVEGAGPFDGKWLLSHTHHRFDEDGYYTDFEVSGRQERSLLGLASLGATGAGSKPVYGAVIGLVTSIKDPEKAGRVKLKFPWLDDSYESDWARTCFPGAGDDRGLMIVPEVDDEVLVMFEFGDVRAPYVIGSLYNGRAKAPNEGYVDDSPTSGGENLIREWKTRRGHTLSFDDDNDHVHLYLEGGKHSIRISSKDDEIVVTSSGSLVLEGKEKVEISGREITISGTNITTEASSQLGLKGGNTKLEGSGQTVIKGGVVQIN